MREFVDDYLIEDAQVSVLMVDIMSSHLTNTTSFTKRMASDLASMSLIRWRKSLCTVRDCAVSDQSSLVS